MGGIKESGEGNTHSSMRYFIYFKNFCKCYSIPPPRTIFKKHKKEYFGLN
jgi:hypothetical protein